MKRSGKPLRRTPIKTHPQGKARPGGGARGKELAKRGFNAPKVPASPAQRAKVAGMRCIVCGRSPVDPAHIVPQRYRGCRHPDCVIPLCRTHHRLYDRRGFRLIPYFDRRLAIEVAHALRHVSRGELYRALDGGGWPNSPQRSNSPGQPGERRSS